MNQFSNNITNTLDRFNVNLDNGFLPSEDPLQSLPTKYKAWDELATELTDYLNAGSFRTRIKELPLIENIDLQSNAQLERAMMLFSYFGHSFIHGPGEKQNHLPANISIPWTKIASQLGRSPIITHGSVVLHNWRRLEPNKDIQLDNLAQLMQFHGGVDESWFFLITVNIEKVGAPAIPLLLETIHHANDNNLDEATKTLSMVIPILERLNKALFRMYEFCDPAIFFSRIRPFVASFENVEYQGVTPAIRSYHGASAAQSSLLQLFDAALGLNYNNNDATKGYLLKMREFMPSKHAALLAHVESISTLHTKANLHPPLKEVYTEAVNQLIQFRNEHLKMASLYIMKQAKKFNASSTGTGGTNPMKFLKSVRNRNEELK